MSRRIILPGEDGEPLFPGAVDLDAKVTRSELAKFSERVTDQLAELSVRVRVHRVRFEALLKLLTHDPDSCFEIVPGSEGPHLRFKLGAYHEYVTKYAAEFAPVHNAILAGRVTVADRVSAATEWNAEHPKMPITAEELKLNELVGTTRRRLTDEEAALPLSLPHSPIFEVGWAEAVKENREIHPE